MKPILPSTPQQLAHSRAVADQPTKFVVHFTSPFQKKKRRRAMQATTLDWSLRPALLGGNSAAIVPRVPARDRLARSTLRGGELAVAPSRPPPRARGARRSSREQIGEAAPDFFSPWPSPGESASICCHDERRAEEAGVRGDRPPRDGDRRARRADPPAPGDGSQRREERRARA